ncbi:ABC transporter ATP-binding protein [Patescibacteria group bacterium]
MKLLDLIKLIWKYLKPHKKVVYFCIFLATIASAISAFIPLMYGRLVDEAIKPKVDFQTIGFMLILWLVFVLLSNWASRFVHFQGNKMGLRGYMGFIFDIYNHYLQLPLSFHKDKKSGENISKIDRSANDLWQIISRVMFNIIPAFLTTTIAIILMFLIEWRMTLIVLIVLFFYSFITIKKTKPIVIAQKKISKSWEKVWGRIYDSTSNINIIKSHVNEYEEKKGVEKGMDKVYESLKSVWILWRNMGAWQNNIQGISFVIVFGVALFLLTKNQITAGVLVSFVGYFNLVFRPFNQLADNYKTVQRSLIIIDRAIKIYDIDKELYDHGKKLAEVKGKIEFKNVSFAYGEKYKTVLNNINFIAQPCETIALVGESGAGKTTLLSLISRYYHLNSGKIFLDNNNLNDINLTFLREQIAIVPQEVSLFNDTLKKNLIYAKKNATDKELITALKSANAWDFVNGFPKKLNSKVGERGIKLSTGQKQRVAIARAILRNPKILILDEATSALDSISERLVQEALKKLIAGRTTFIIAHRLSTITHANNILVFDKGKLVEQGNHQELVNQKGVYWGLYKEQKF